MSVSAALRSVMYEERIGNSIVMVTVGSSLGPTLIVLRDYLADEGALS